MRNGFLLVDKPTGFTSHDIVAVVRRGLGERRVGHAGTLDPAATGLLVLGVGRSTRLLTFLVGADKRYEAVIRLGLATDTDDAEGQIIERSGAGHVGDRDLTASILGFVGRIAQTPATVSAIKVSGKPAHRRVRDGESVQLRERNVTVHSLEVDSIARRWVEDVRVVDVALRVHVSSGTYVRALARDLGRHLGSGGHLVSLRRTSVGPFEVAEGFSGINELAGRRDNPPSGPSNRSGPKLQDFLVSAESVVTRALPVAIIANEQADAVLHGQRIVSEKRSDEPTALVSESGSLLSVAETANGMWRYRVVVGEPSPNPGGGHPMRETLGRTE